MEKDSQSNPFSDNPCGSIRAAGIDFPKGNVAVPACPVDDGYIA
jgi:hypothetical protein